MKTYQPWKLEEGLKLVRALQGRVREFGYHITLGGGVLNKGESDKDLDLYFLPYNNPSVAKENPDGLIEWLSVLWGEPQRIGNYAEDAPSQPVARADRLPQMARVNGQWVIQRVPPPTFVNEDEPVPASQTMVMPAEDEDRPMLRDGEWARNLPKKAKAVSSYKFKLKFERSGGDRIDVFII